MDLDLLNPEQRRAVEYGDGPLMVLAGAGSGKTRVLVHRIAQLVERDVPAHRVLAVTFTNKAAGEMRERLTRLLGARVGGMWIGTFHAICARLLRKFGERVGLTRDFTIFDDDDQRKLVADLLKEHNLADQATPRSVLWRIDRCKNRGDDPAEIDSQSYLDEIVRRLYPLYRDRLAREDAVDFNDLLLKVLDLARDDEIGPVLAGLFTHVLVDEFQDTNLVQYRLVRHFVRLTRNLTVVGDDDQSIYAWRGAEPRNLLDFDRDFADAAVVKLEQNYRSTDTILTAANAVIAKNLDRHAKALWTQRAGGEPVLWEEAVDDRREAEFIAQGIQGLISQEGLDPGDAAVLYRTHAQSRLLEEFLRAYGLPYKVVGGTSFFMRREIKDVRAYVKLLINHASDTSFERIVNVPARGIGSTTINRIKTHARVARISLVDACRSCAHGAVSAIGPAVRKKLAAFIAIFDELREVHARGGSVADTLIHAIERSGYRERLEIEDSPESRDRLENLGQLVAMAADFDRDTEGKGTLGEFDERISLASANDADDGRGSSVTLMTIHAAKGLEFPVVFLAGMEDGLFPSLREREDVPEHEALEEERRLAYVAMTRAMDRLILTGAAARRTWNELRANRPSRFIADIPPEVLALRRRPERRPPVRRSELPAYRRREVDPLDQRVEYGDDLPEFDVLDDLDCDGPDEAAGAGGGKGRGATVQHQRFGTGRVLESRGVGRDRKLVIEFPGAGIKTILARYVE